MNELGKQEVKKEIENLIEIITALFENNLEEDDVRFLAHGYLECIISENPEIFKLFDIKKGEEFIIETARTRVKEKSNRVSLMQSKKEIIEDIIDNSDDEIEK